MTRQKTFKRRVRARMARTGESYTAARRLLIAQGDRPDAVDSPFTPRISEEKLQEATGRTWRSWFARLDETGAVRRPHREIARWLIEEHALDHWWAQTITVGYEQARGLRAPGQNATGFEVSVSKTVSVPVRRLYRAFVDDAQRRLWLPAAELRLRTATPHKSARYDWEDGSTRVNVGFTQLDATKSRIAIGHERLPDSDTAEEMRAFWRGRVAALKPMLEGGG